MAIAGLDGQLLESSSRLSPLYLRSLVARRLVHAHLGAGNCHICSPGGSYRRRQAQVEGGRFPTVSTSHESGHGCNRGRDSDPRTSCPTLVVTRHTLLIAG